MLKKDKITFEFVIYFNAISTTYLPSLDSPMKKYAYH